MAKDGGQVTNVPLPTARRWLIFLAIASPLLLVGMDSTMVASALPVIERAFGGDLAWVSWVVTVHALGQVVMLPIGGRLGDLLGRRRVLVASLLSFAVASLACSLSGQLAQLIAFRAVQATAGGTFLPIATGVAAEHFGAARDRIIGIFSSIFPIGAVLGPLVGGMIVTLGDWRGMFVVSAVASLAAAVLVGATLPRSRARDNASIDVIGLTVFAITILAFMGGASFLGDPQTEPAALHVAACGVLGILAASAFVVRIRSATSPFIPPSLLAGSGFGTMNIFNVFYGAAAVGFVVLVPVYAHYRFGLDPFASGTLMIPRAIGTIVVSGIAVMLLRRTGYRTPIALGSATTAAGLAAHAWIPTWAEPYLWLFGAGVVAGIGIGIAVPAANNAALRLAPHWASSIAGVRAMFRQSGVIVAVATSTAIATRSADPGLALATAFAAFAAIMLLLLALLPFIPDHRGSW